MTQTLLSLMALMLTILFVFNQHQYVLHTQMSMLESEVSMQASGVAVDRLEEIGRWAFDDKTKGGAQISSALELTPAANFTDDAPPIDDIDDFNTSAPVLRYRVTSQDTLTFAVLSEITYASETNPEIAVVDPAVRTKYKKATVWVYSLDLPTPDTVRLSQSYACGSACNW